jgi:dipeptidyl aminopeptidase/acylaminoacyl peptidase
VSVSGPTDLVTLVESFPPYWSTTSGLWYKKLGHPVRDRDDLLSRSPVALVDSIQVPVMVVHGANDARVAQEDVDRFVRALEKREIPVEYMLFPDEGHRIQQPENRLKMYARIETFLAEHLGR